MHTFVSLNSRIVDRDKARIHAISGAALYGKGVFTTIAVFDGRPHLWEKHWRRLTTDANKVGIQINSFREREVYDAVNEIVAHNAVASGRARVTLLDESSTALWAFDDGRGPGLLIATSESHPPTTGARLGLSPCRINTTSPLAEVKSCNYLENLMSLEEAKGREFDEAIRLNEKREVTSACMANVFWLANGRLFTPSLKTGCLRGTTREFVMENLDCEEVEAGLEELSKADSIFLTSAGLGVVRVIEFDGKHLAGEGHPILGLIPCS